MRDLLSSDTVVVGVGNTILSDDGAGVQTARLLQGDPRVPAGVTILDGGTLGLELMPYISDASRVPFLDAVNSGEAPGTLTRMTGRDLLGTSGGWSVHQLGVADLIAALALVSARPQDIVVLGVQPANTDWVRLYPPAWRPRSRVWWMQPWHSYGCGKSRGAPALRCTHPRLPDHPPTGQAIDARTIQ